MLKLTNDVNMFKWLRRRARKKSHREYLWRNIYELRQGIIEDVLWASRDGEHLLEPELLVHKANLIRKYSRRLKVVDL